jgi:DNA-binding transcriptional LysR family regulator
MMRLFRAEHPQMSVQVRIGNAREVLRWLGEAQIDVAVASDPPGDAAFSYHPLATDGLTCAMPRDHHMADLESVPVAILARETLLIREPTSKTRSITERALADADVRPLAVIEVQNREAIREAVALGVGVSVFFTSECPPDPRLAYRPLNAGPREYEMRTYLVYQSERKRSALLRALRAIASQMS